MEQSVSTGSAVVSVTKYPGRPARQTLDFVAVEEPLEIVVVLSNGEKTSLGLTMRTPGRDKDLAVGLLFSEGVIGRMADIASISTAKGRCSRRGSTEIRITLSANVRRLPVHLDAAVKTAACGLCGRTDIEHVLRSVQKVSSSHAPLSPTEILRMPDIVRDQQQVFDRTGGLHAAALFDRRGELLQLREDIGRHNAVDKVIGWGVGEAIEFGELTLFLSGRAGFELVHKAAYSGIPFVVAVGAPSSLAVDLAARCGVTLVGFARNETFNVYTEPDRIQRRPHLLQSAVTE